MAKKKNQTEVETPVEETVDPSTFKRVHKVEKKKTKIVLTKKMIALIGLAVVLVVGVIAAYIIVGNNKGYSTSVTNSSKNIITGDITVTKQGYYEYLMDNYGASEVVSEAYTKIADKLITDTSAINKLVKSKEKTYASYMGTLKSYATSMGYSTVKEFEEKLVIPDAKQELLVKKYLTDEFTAACKKYEVSYVKKITVAKESTALKILKKSTSSAAFTKLMDQYGSKATDMGLVSTKTSSLSSAIKKIRTKLYATTKDGVYPSVVKISSSSYAVLYIYNTDKSAHKDKIVSDLSSIDGISTDVEAYYLKKYDFTVYDEKVKKAVNKISSKYITD